MEILVESAVRITVLAVVVAALLGGLRKGSPRAAHQAWVGVTLLMLLLPRREEARPRQIQING